MKGSRLNDLQMPPRRDTITRQHVTTRGLALIGAGLLTLALLVAAGMGPAAPMASADSLASGVTVAQPPAQRPARGVLVARCPEGTILIIFDQPVYDPSGLFVIGSKPVPYCVPEDLEPAG